jgi:hypothetical protein
MECKDHNPAAEKKHSMGFRRTLQLTLVPIIPLISEIHIADKTDSYLVLHVGAKGTVKDGIYISASL